MTSNIPTEVPADTIDRINTEYSAAKAADANALSHAIVCGEALNDAFAIVEHGNWLKWLRENCSDVHQTTSNDYRHLAAHRVEIETKGTALSIRAALKAFPAKPRKPRVRRTPSPKTSVDPPLSSEPQPDETLSNWGPDEVFAQLRTRWTPENLDKLGELIAEHLAATEAA
jgi:hypothetical protein